jgi:hypothetical protein
MRQRYAAHYLKLGSSITTYPLLVVEEGRIVSLTTFTEEQEGIIFLNGTIQLVPEGEEPLDNINPTSLNLLTSVQMLVFIQGYGGPLKLELPKQ